jgi:type I restriction enzyme S subunit
MIPETWRTIPLGDVIELKRGYDLPTSDRVVGKYPIVSSSGPSGWHHEYKAKGPGVVTGRYGTLGQVFFVRDDYWPLNTTLYVRDFKGNDERFISYFLRSLDFQSCNDKSSVPGLNRNDLHRLEVSVPAPVEQRAIASALGALDDKIEHNRRTSRALEGLARAMFKAWFVDFEPVRAKAAGATSFPGMPPEAFAALPSRFTDSELGPVPEGWGVASLPQLAVFLNGLALQKYPPRADGSDLPVIKIAELRKGSTAGADAANGDVPPQFVINDGDLLFSWSGTLEVRRWFGGKGALNQHLFKVTPARTPQWFIHHAVLTHLPDFRAIASSKATTMGHIQRKHLDAALAPTPAESILSHATAILDPVYSLVANLSIESRSLAQMRDYLLPKLLSGEVRLNVPERPDGR